MNGSPLLGLRAKRGKLLEVMIRPSRWFAYAAAQGVEEPGALPERRGGHQAHLFGLAKHHQIVEKPTADLEDGSQPIRDPIRGEI